GSTTPPSPCSWRWTRGAPPTSLWPSQRRSIAKPGRCPTSSSCGTRRPAIRSICCVPSIAASTSTRSSGRSRADAGGDGGRVAREQRVRARRGRAGLRQEQGGEEERVIGKLDDPDLARAAETAHPESAGLEPPMVVRVDTVVAEKVLGRLRDAVQR